MPQAATGQQEMIGQAAEQSSPGHVSESLQDGLPEIAGQTFDDDAGDEFLFSLTPSR